MKHFIISFLLCIILMHCQSDTVTDATNIPKDCSDCPIQQSTSEMTANNSTQRVEAGEIGGSLKIDVPIVKKLIDAELAGKGDYKNSEEALEKVYWKIAGGDDELTQYANLYRTVNCAMLQLICEDTTLTAADQSMLKRQYVERYGEKVDEIVARSMDKKKADRKEDAVEKPAAEKITPAVSNTKPATSAGETNFNVDIKGDNKGQVIQGETINIQTINSGGKKDEG